MAGISEHGACGALNKRTPLVVVHPHVQFCKNGHDWDRAVYYLDVAFIGWTSEEEAAGTCDNTAWRIFPLGLTQ